MKSKILTEGKHNFSIPSRQLKKGIYFIKAIADGYSHYNKLVIE